MASNYDFPKMSELRAQMVKDDVEGKHDKHCIEVILHRVQVAMKNGKNIVEIDGQSLPSDSEAL